MRKSLLFPKRASLLSLAATPKLHCGEFRIITHGGHPCEKIPSRAKSPCENPLRARGAQAWRCCTCIKPSRAARTLGGGVCVCVCVCVCAHARAGACM